MGVRAAGAAGGAIWVWHVPALFNATVTDEFLHRIQHISFLFSAFISWWAIFRRRRNDYGAGVIHVFATMVHMSLLGALLTMAPHLLYREQTASAPKFGLTPLEDQQLGGLVMWVPAGTVYAAIALAMVWIWIAETASTNAAFRTERPDPEKT